MKPYAGYFGMFLIFLLSFNIFSDTNLPIHSPAASSLANHLVKSHTKDPIDGGWLPNLTGLPTESQIIQLTQNMQAIMEQETDPRCKAIDKRLRMTIFQHFLIYQQMLNNQQIFLSNADAYQWAHVLGMILKESNGDSASISDIEGRSISTYQSQSNLSEWHQIFHLTQQKKIQFNYQTNFGLTQSSADRLFNAFKLAQTQITDTQYLDNTIPFKLNAAIAIRRLIWFYQDFAQGRISEADKRIKALELYYPENYIQYREGLKMALLYCGTAYLFNNGQGTDQQLLDAMSSIAYCKLGNPQEGYGQSNMDIECYAAWVTLCPALNIDIATLTPLEYFATRGQPPVCESTFLKLLNMKQ